MGRCKVEGLELRVVVNAIGSRSMQSLDRSPSRRKNLNPKSMEHNSPKPRIIAIKPIILHTFGAQEVLFQQFARQKWRVFLQAFSKDPENSHAREGNLHQVLGTSPPTKHLADWGFRV